MKSYICALLLTTAILPACVSADRSLGRPVAELTMKDGHTFKWENTKNIDLEISEDKVSIKSVTPEQAMANVAASNAAVAAALAKIADIIAPLIPAAAKAGALAAGS